MRVWDDGSALLPEGTLDVLELRVQPTQAGLLEAAAAVASSGEAHVRWVFTANPIVESPVLSRVAGVLSGAPAVRRLVLVHPGAAVHFLATSLTLRVPNVTIEVETGARQRAEWFERETLSAAANPSYTVRIALGGDLEATAALALDPVRRWVLRGLIVALQGSSDLVVPEVAPALAPSLLHVAGLEYVMLVHPSVALHDVAAEVRKRCADLQVIACRSEVEASQRLAEALGDGG